MNDSIYVVNAEGGWECDRTGTLYHLELTRDPDGRERYVVVYDVPVALRIAMAQARLSRERQPCVRTLAAVA
jgi:hypothetical protein